MSTIRDWSDESLQIVALVLRQLVDEARAGNGHAGIYEQAACVQVELARRACHEQAPDILRAETPRERTPHD